MCYQKVFKMPESIPCLSVGLDVGADFTWMSIILPNGVLIGKPFRIIYSDPQFRELAISKIKEAQEMYSLENRCFLGSTGIYHIQFLCFLRDKGFDCVVTNPIITKGSTNMNVRKLHSGELGSKKAAKVGLDASLKAFIAPNDAIIDLRNLVHDHYYFEDLQPAIVLRLHVKSKVPFPAHLNVFSRTTTQTSLKLLEAYPLAADMLAAPKDKLIETIRNTARFGETHALVRYDAICTAAKDAAVFECAFPSNALWIRLCIKTYRGYQAYLDSILEELYQAVGKLGGTPGYDRISFIQTLHSVGLLGATALITEVGAFDLFSSPKKFYAYFGLSPGVNDSDKFHGGRVHMSKRGSNPAGCTLRMVAVNNLKVGKAIETLVNSVIYNYYTREYASKEKSAAVGAVIHKICNIIFAMFQDNESLELTTLEEHRKHYATGYPEFMNPAA